MNYRIFEESFNINLLEDFFLANKNPLFFYVNDCINLKNEPINIITGSLSFLKAYTIKSLADFFDFVDSKAEICSIEGKDKFIKKVESEIDNQKDEIYFQLPLFKTNVVWISVYLKRMKDKGIYTGIIKRS